MCTNVRKSHINAKILHRTMLHLHLFGSETLTGKPYGPFTRQLTHSVHYIINFKEYINVLEWEMNN